MVKTPLNDIDRLNHRRLCRLAAGLGICLFAIVYQDRSLRVEKFQFAVKHRDRRLPIRSDGYHEFGSSYRAVRCRSFDSELTRFFAAKKISGTLFDIQRRFAAWCLRRFNFVFRILVHAERSEERRVGKRGDLGGRRIIKKKKNKNKNKPSRE